MQERQPIDGFLRIDTCGQVHIIGAALRRRLARENGRYRFSGREHGAITFEKAPELRPVRELDAPILLSGSIDKISSMADIINLVAIARYDTHMVVIDSVHRHTISFLKGRLSGGFSTDSSNRLGEIIHRQGFIGRNVLDRSLVEARSARRPIGNYLVEQGHLTPAELLLSIEKQAKTIFGQCLHLETGDFFLTELDSSHYQPLVDLDTQRALFDALTTHDELLEFERRLLSHATIGVRPGVDERPRSTGPVPPLDSLMLSLLAEPTPCVDVIKRHSGDKKDVLATLMRLERLGLVELKHGNDNRISEFVPLPEPLNLSKTTSMLRMVNEAFQKLYESAKHASGTSPLDGALETFLQFYGYTDLFAGLAYNSDGLLDEVKLLQNLNGIESDDPHAYLERALHELLHFALYASKDSLDRSELREMQHSLTVLFSQTPYAQGAP